MAATISVQLLASILRQYPLSRPRVVESLEASKRNDSFLVEDAAGVRYVLRRYRRNIDERRVLFQLRFQQQLLECGFPTSAIVESESETLFVASEAGLWALFSYIEGEEYDYSRMAQVAEAGRRLAEFHTVSDSIKLKDVDIEINPHPRRWWTHAEEEIAELEQMFAGQGVEGETAFLRDWQAQLVHGWWVRWLGRVRGLKSAASRFNYHAAGFPPKADPPLADSRRYRTNGDQGAPPL